MSHGQAIHCWWQSGHPGWAIWPVDSHQFVRDMQGTVRSLSLFGPYFMLFALQPGLTHVLGQVTTFSVSKQTTAYKDEDRACLLTDVGMRCNEITSVYSH